MDHSLQLISPLQRAFYLKRLSGLRDIPPANLAAIALLAEEHSFSRGAVLCRTGERVDRVHVVVDGRVHVRGGEHGDEVLGTERSIGMLSLLARDDTGLDAVAETDTQTLALRADDLFSAFEEDFGILYNQIRDLAAQTLRVRRQTPDGAYLGGSLLFLGDVPTGDLDVVQKLLFMRDSPLRSAPMDALITMAQHMRTARFEPRTRLWEIGAPSGFMYVLLEGSVRCTTEDGRQFVCGPGYPLGNLESQCDAPRWYAALTDTTVTALRSDVDVFLDTLEQHSGMAIDFVAGMASALITRRAELRKEIASPAMA
jgi:CRP-like cAMP-binding protein